MSQDSVFKTIGVATGICLFCSLFVSVAAVKLRPRQIENQKLDKIQNILLVAGLADEAGDTEAIYNERIEPIYVELSTGEVLAEDKYQPDLVEPVAAAQDIAGIKVQPTQAVVYQRMDNGAMTRLILPIHGKGLWSTLYGFLALESDLQTVAGITFYEHGETPGLGGEIDNPNWKGSWQGKQAYDDNGSVVIEVIKGQVDPDNPNANRQIDGLSGATLTARGVDNIIQFWLSDSGYGPTLKRLREEPSI
jgi:Na+-transporting NADH:ubiquinone oxidoreductase subunit C